MDVIDRYFQLLSESAQQCAADEVTVMDIMAGDRTLATLDELCKLRSEFIENADRTRIDGYLDLGFFRGQDPDERVVALTVAFELDDLLAKEVWRRRCEPYRAEHPLFSEMPGLLREVRDAELVNVSSLSQLRNTELIQVDHHWAKLDPSLPPEILVWVRQSFPRSPTFVRLDPTFISNVQPRQQLWEATIRPALPGWWDKLTLYAGTKTGAHYVLEKPIAPDPLDIDPYIEYHSRGIRSLEIHAIRRGDGNLSMMLEELVVARETPILLGRCIHLDTDAPFGSPVSKATLNHLDLAVNLYFDASAADRRGVSLANGKVTDATVRTHLLRIENVPFPSLLEFARLFFRSTTLFSEWVEDQFRVTS